MFTFKTLAFAAIALGTVAVATPAEAHDRRYRHKHVHGRVVVYDTPGYHREYRPYRHRYYRSYDSRPRVTIAFGGNKYRTYDRHHRYYRYR